MKFVDHFCLFCILPSFTRNYTSASDQTDANTGYISPRKPYQKPSISAGACFTVIDEIKTHHWQGNKCMSCEFSQEVCPNNPPCQVLIDELYRKCDGVKLPSGTYFDPALSIAGSWDNDDVRVKVKISVEKCGCSSAKRLHFVITPTLVAIIFFAIMLLLE